MFEAMLISMLGMTFLPAVCGFFLIPILICMTAWSTVLLREGRHHARTSAFYEQLRRDQARMYEY